MMVVVIQLTLPVFTRPFENNAPTFATSKDNLEIQNFKQKIIPMSTRNFR